MTLFDKKWYRGVEYGKLSICHHWTMKSSLFGFRGYSQMKFYKSYITARNGLVWFGKGMFFMLICDQFW